MTSDDYEIDDEPCPKCGSSDTRVQFCGSIGCDAGHIDEYDDDPINYSSGFCSVCDECHGYGVLRWCAACGHDLNKKGEVSE
jgi:hypothetical protein